MTKEELFAKLDKVTNLPTLPPIIQRLTTAVGDPNSNAEFIAAIIKDDQSMMARIVKTVNSAAYGFSEPIYSIQQAISTMGFRAVRNVALSTAVYTSLGQRDAGRFNRKEFWRHAISTGIGMNVLYKSLRAPTTQTFPPTSCILPACCTISARWCSNRSPPRISPARSTGQPSGASRSSRPSPSCTARPTPKSAPGSPRNGTCRRSRASRALAPHAGGRGRRTRGTVPPVPHRQLHLQPAEDRRQRRRRRPVLRAWRLETPGLSVPDIADIVQRIEEESLLSETLLAL